MKNILEVLSEKHAMWIKYMISFGCSKDNAEDYVQDMYLKLYDYSLRKDNDLMYDDKSINFYFVYVTLKNMFTSNIRTADRMILLELNEDIDFIDDEEYIETNDFYLQKQKVANWVVFIDNKIDSIKDYTEEKAQLYYIKSLYQLVLVEKRNVTKLSKELNISYWSIRNTINIIKRQIRDDF